VRVQVATYNVQSGGFENYRDYENTEPPRLEALQEAVAATGAEVIGLTDTFRWHEIFSTADLRKIFGYEHAAAVSIDDSTMGPSGQAIGLTLLSQREIVRHRTVPIGERHALQADIELDDMTIVSLFTAYLHHGDEDTRVKQANDIVEHASPEGIMDRVLVLADLNSVHTEDDKVARLRSLLDRVPKKLQAGLVSEMRAVLSGHTYQELLTAGLEDANHAAEASWPTKHFRLAGRIALPPLLRVDHILHSSDLVGMAETLRGSVYHRASDHFPVSGRITAQD
jgi:endonuclease/exonuclease/phosphatase family metal-dependent hydrolase